MAVRSLARDVPTIVDQPSISVLQPVAIREDSTVCKSVIETKMKKNMYSIVCNFVGISGYPQEPGQFIASSLTRCWSLRIYPGGLDEESQGFLSCFVAYEEDEGVTTTSSSRSLCSNARGAFKLEVLNQNGWKNKEFVSEVKTFGYSGCIWGDRKFISKKDMQLSDNGIIVNDSLTIQVNLVVYGEVIQSIKSESIQFAGPSKIQQLPASSSTTSTPSKYHHNTSTSTWGLLLDSSNNNNTTNNNMTSNLVQDLARVLEDSSMSDLTIFVEDESGMIVDQFAVHKFVLSLRSPVFRAMLFNGLSESSSAEIVMKDFSGNVVKGLLQYIYTDTCPEDIDQSGEQLLAISAKYQVTGLLSICESHLCSAITSLNVANLLFLADMFCAHRLKAHALHFIASHSKAVITGTTGTHPGTGTGTGTGTPSGNETNFFQHLNFPLCQDIIKALAGIHIDTICTPISNTSLALSNKSPSLSPTRLEDSGPL